MAGKTQTKAESGDKDDSDDDEAGAGGRRLRDQVDLHALAQAIVRLMRDELRRERERMGR